MVYQPSRSVYNLHYTQNNGDGCSIGAEGSSTGIVVVALVGVLAADKTRNETHGGFGSNVARNIDSLIDDAANLNLSQTDSILSSFEMHDGG